jgi:hypothetical protein
MDLLPPRAREPEAVPAGLETVNPAIETPSAGAQPAYLPVS